MDMAYTDKCRYEIQEQKEVPVWYAGIHWPISSTGYTRTSVIKITAWRVQVMFSKWAGFFPSLQLQNRLWDSTKTCPMDTGGKVAGVWI
jgi:hypothetical protein